MWQIYFQSNLNLFSAGSSVQALIQGRIICYDFHDLSLFQGSEPILGILSLFPGPDLRFWSFWAYSGGQNPDLNLFQMVRAPILAFLGLFWGFRAIIWAFWTYFGDQSPNLGLFQRVRSYSGKKEPWFGPFEPIPEGQYPDLGLFQSIPGARSSIWVISMPILWVKALIWAYYGGPELRFWPFRLIPGVAVHWFVPFGFILRGRTPILVIFVPVPRCPSPDLHVSQYALAKCYQVKFDISWFSKTWVCVLLDTFQVYVRSSGRFYKLRALLLWRSIYLFIYLFFCLGSRILSMGHSSY